MGKYEGKLIGKMELEQVKKLYADSDRTPESMRKAFFSVIRNYDMIPENLVPVVLRFVARFYDKEGLGYTGVMEEITDRVNLYAMIDGYVFAKEFLLHKANQTDIYDRENRTGYEKKTGCGDWLRSENPVFAEVIEEYKRKRTMIRWDYTFTVESKKNGKEEFAIHIETTFKKLFSFLAEYDGDIATWFKENARSGRAGVYVWEMQTIRTSRKKAVYLSSFAEWEKANK